MGMLRSMPTGPAGPRTVEGPFGLEPEKTCFWGTIYLLVVGVSCEIFGIGRFFLVLSGQRT